MQDEMMQHTNGHSTNGTLKHGIATGLMASAATTATVMAASQVENHDIWTAINNISHILFGEENSSAPGFLSKQSLSGLGMNAAAATGWGVLYEKLFGKVEFPKSLLTGAAAAAAIYAVDYHVVPKRFTPGFEKSLDKKAIGLTYVILGLTFALSPLWKRKK